jgi:hypothetical protein
MKNLKLVLAVVLGAALAACGSPAKVPTGGVKLSVNAKALWEASAPPDLTVYQVYLEGICTSHKGTCTDLSYIFDAPTAWPVTQLVQDLPTGFSYDFRASVRGGANLDVLLYEGSAPFTVEEDKVGTLHIIMQQVVAPGTVAVTAPFIRSITVSNENPAVGERLTFKANVKDLDGTETAQWTSSCNGTPSVLNPDVFSEPTFVGVPDVTLAMNLSTTFTSRCVGTETIKLSVTAPAADATLGRSLVSSVQFALKYDAQGFNADIGFNAWPDILGVGVLGNAQLQPGESVQLDVNAVDADGDDLVYTWLATCDGGPGVFSSQLVKSPIFTAPGAGKCVIEVCVSDYKGFDAGGLEMLRGGYNDATLTLNVGTNGLPIP